MARRPSNLFFQICVYPSANAQSAFVAYCLNPGVCASGGSVQQALDLLLEHIERRIQTSGSLGNPLRFSAPREIWRKYRAAKEAEQYVPCELVERVATDANKRPNYPLRFRLDLAVID